MVTAAVLVLVWAMAKAVALVLWSEELLVAESALRSGVQLA